MQKDEELVSKNSQAGPLGYAVTFIEDLGNGRQVQVAFGLKLDAPRAALDKHLDTIRLAMNRQKASGTIRDFTHKLDAERKIIDALERMLAQTKDINNVEAITAAKSTLDEMQRALDAMPKGVNVTRSQKDNQLQAARLEYDKVVQQVLQERRAKSEELLQRKTNVQVYESAIAIAEAEIAGIDAS